MHWHGSKHISSKDEFFRLFKCYTNCRSISVIKIFVYRNIFQTTFVAGYLIRILHFKVYVCENIFLFNIQCSFVFDLCLKSKCINESNTWGLIDKRTTRILSLKTDDLQHRHLHAINIRNWTNSSTFYGVRCCYLLVDALIQWKHSVVRYHLTSNEMAEIL